jgi:hypothetical protein
MRDAFGVERSDISKSSQPASVKRERMYAAALRQSTPEYVPFSGRRTTASTKRKIGAAKTGNQQAVQVLRSEAKGPGNTTYPSEGVVRHLKWKKKVGPSSGSTIRADVKEYLNWGKSAAKVGRRLP